MKKTLVLFFSFYSFNLLAIDPSACSSSTSEGMAKCLNEVTKTLPKVGMFEGDCLVLTSAKETRFSHPALYPEFDTKGAICDQFLSTEPGKGYGDWGKIIVDYINEQGADSIYLSNNLAGMSDGVNACPKWKRLTASQKKHFWVWTFASIAHVEATCKDGASNPSGTNGVAMGLLQLDDKISNRRWRGPNCRVKSVRNAKENLRCGMDIMGELLKGRSGEYKGNGNLWGRASSSYWQHMRGNDGGEIASFIKKHPLCR